MDSHTIRSLKTVVAGFLNFRPKMNVPKPLMKKWQRDAKRVKEFIAELEDEN